MNEVVVHKKLSTMKWYMCVLVLVFCAHHGESMTEAQMKSAGKMIRNVCQPKAKVTDEQIQKVHDGVWEEDEGIACYYKCVLQMMKITKNTEFLVDSALAQVPTLPESRREPTKKVVEECQNAGDGETNKCQFGYKIAHCMYTANPSNFFLP